MNDLVLQRLTSTGDEGDFHLWVAGFRTSLLLWAEAHLELQQKERYLELCLQENDHTRNVLRGAQEIEVFIGTLRLMLEQRLIERTTGETPREYLRRRWGKDINQLPRIEG